MTVSEIMKTDVATCTLEDDLASVAKIMHERSCGFLPVIDSHGLVTGVITDRDVCTAAADGSRPMTRHGVKDAMSHPVFSCFPDENVKVTMATMARRHVRRLTVLDRQGHLQGVLSIDDVIQAPGRRGAPTSEEIVAALKGIGAPKTVEVTA
ncbi:MAG: CBS domain-containing protein [Vicinamibacterales bacterium]